MARVAYCIEPLARPDCNFVNTLAEAAEIVRRIGNPSLRIMVDTLAASLMEPEPVADAIRRWMPTGLVAHVQFNDRNRRGPGQGDDRFAPVVAGLARNRLSPAGSPWSLSSMSPTGRPARRA